MAAAEQGHIGGPPVPRPLLTSLAAIPGAGEEGCVTNNECDLLRRDAQVCGAMLAAVLALAAIIPADASMAAMIPCPHRWTEST